MRASDEDRAESRPRRIPLNREQPVGEHVPRFVQPHGTDLRHGPQLREDLKHVVRAAQDARHEAAETIEPLSPRGRRRPGRERVDDRQREAAEVLEVVQIAGVPERNRRLGIVARLFADPEPQLLREAIEPAMPPVGAADHRRLDDQTLPLPRRTQGAFDDRRELVRG